MFYADSPTKDSPVSPLIGRSYANKLKRHFAIPAPRRGNPDQPTARRRTQEPVIGAGGTEQPWALAID